MAKGITYGGVGDAIHNFDIESSYGLLESFALVYEYSGDKEWLSLAEDMANQFATWVINYDYAFPEGTLFGKLSMKTCGTGLPIPRTSTLPQVSASILALHYCVFSGLQARGFI